MSKYLIENLFGIEGWNIAWYGAIRFAVEGLRTDSLYIIPGLRVSQLLSLILVVCGCVFVIIMRHKAPMKKSTP